ncbi:MAG: hypothetical protein GC191_10160 [Azospirillum sp.]|nr:hypothetical protein [Azospirillum sp.]
MSDFLDDLAADVQDALADMAGPLVYRTVTSYSPKASATAAIGATTISLNTLPAGFDRTLPGDTFSSGSRTFSVETVASAGTITAAPFSPALAVAISSGAAVPIVRTVDTSCQGWMELLDTSTVLAPGVQIKDAKYSVLANSLAVVPAIGARMVGPDGVARTIRNIGQDPAQAFWIVLANG